MSMVSTRQISYLTVGCHLIGSPVTLALGVLSPFFLSFIPLDHALGSSQ